MVRLITLLLVLGVLYLYTVQAQESKPIQKVPGQSIITVEELPPIRAENE